MAWNKPSGEVKKPADANTAGRAKAFAAVAAGALVCAGVVVLVFLRDGKDGAAQADERDGSAAIREVKPAAAPKAEAARPLTEAERIFNETNGMSLGALRQWEFKNWKGPVYTNGVGRPKTLEERTFSHSSDRLIAGMLRLEPGTSLVGDSKYIFNDFFRKSFKKSLEETIVIGKDDTDEVKELKRAVIETRKELKERADAGEDVCDILIKTRDEYRQLGLYRQEVEKMVKEACADNDFSDNDVKDCIGAANRMLAERGAKPLTLPTVYGRMLRMKRLRAEQKLENGNPGKGKTDPGEK